MIHRLNNLFGMRHANSQANKDFNTYKTMPDHAIPLSDEGWLQSIMAGRKFAGFLSRNPQVREEGIRLWYSPYLRTKQTRDGFMEGLGSFSDAIRDMRENILLAEQNFGLFDGLTEEEKAALYPEEYRKVLLCEQYKGKFYAKPPNGESRYDVCVRVHQFFGTIIRDAERQDDPVPNVLLISHGTTLRALIMMWLHKEVEWFENEPNPNNCCIRHIGRDGNGGHFKDMGILHQGVPDQVARRNTRRPSGEKSRGE